MWGMEVNIFGFKAQISWTLATKTRGKSETVWWYSSHIKNANWKVPLEWACHRAYENVGQKNWFLFPPCSFHLGCFRCSSSDPFTLTPSFQSITLFSFRAGKATLLSVFLHLISGHSWVNSSCNLEGNVYGGDVNHCLTTTPLTSFPSIYGSISWSTEGLARIFVHMFTVCDCTSVTLLLWSFWLCIL